MPSNKKGYKTIKGFPMYRIYTDGKIYSKYSGEWKEIIRIPNSRGYEIVNLCRNKKMYNKRVHQLVAQHFIENPSKYKSVLHKDGNPLNNNVGNLYWGTQKMNHDDSKRHGTVATGERHGQGVLNWWKVDLMRILREDRGWSYNKIAKFIGVCNRTAMMVCKYETWILSN